MSDDIGGLLRTVNDLNESQWTRKNALDDLIDLGAIKELVEIINDKEKSDWVRKQALEGLAKNGASKELKEISDNPVIATWVRKTCEKLLSKMVKKPKEYVEVSVAIDPETGAIMKDIASNTSRSMSDVIISFIEEGKSAQKYREEVKKLTGEVHALKEEIISLQDLKEFNAKLRREKTILHDQSRKMKVNLNTRSKEVEFLNRAVGYTKEYADTLKRIIEELDCEFVDHFSCPKCGSTVTLITEYKINNNKIEATNGYCLNCL